MSFSGESVGSIHGTLNLDREPFTRGLEAARAQVKAFEDERHRVVIDAVLNGMDGAKAQLAAIRDRTIKIKLDIDTAAIERLRLLLDSLKSQTAGVHIIDAAALAKIDELQRKIDALHGKTVKVNVDQSAMKQAWSNLDVLKSKWGAIGTAAVTVGPSILGALGQATLGAGALGVATGGAALSFGVLGKAVQDTLTGQATQVTQLRAIATAQKQLTALQNQGATASIAIARAQASLVAAEKSGNAQRIALATQNLAVVESTKNSQLQGNAQLIQASKQHLAALQADYNGQNALAQKVNTSIANVKNTIESALAPAVQQVLHGMLPLLQTLASAIGGLSGPFKVLGEAVRKAFADPATQAGIRALISGFGDIVKASAPLAGPIVRALISLGKILENIAKAAMPVLVSAMKEFAGWLGHVANTTATPKFAAEIKKWSEGFLTLVKDVKNLAKALLPIFSSAAGFQPVIAAVTSIVGWFVKLLANAGPLGRLFLGGLGIAFIAGRFNGLKTALGLAHGAFKLLAAGVLSLVTKSFGPLLTAFPKLVTAFWGLDAVVSGGSVAAFGAAALAVAPYVAAVVGIGVLVAVVIKFHKQIEDAIADAWAWVKKHVKIVIEAILFIISGGFAAIPILIFHFHKQIEKVIADSWEWIKGAIGDALKFIEGLCSKAWKLVEGIFVKAWDLIKDAVVKGIDLVLGVVKTLLPKVLHALGDIGSFLFNAGKQLIQGLINGIGSMFSDLAGTAGKILSTITGGISGFLFGSPSRLTHKWGQWIGQGLINGMLSTHAAVGAAAKQLVSAANVGPVLLGAGVQQPTTGGAGGPGSGTALSELAAIHKASDQLVKLATTSAAALAKLVQLATPAQGALGTASSVAGAGSRPPGLGAPQLLGPGVQQPTSSSLGGQIVGQPLIVHNHFNSLVPGTPAQLRQISATVTEAHRRNTPGKPPGR